MERIIVNEADVRAIMRARQSLLGSLDEKRPQAWTQFGYPDTVTFERLLSAYRRGGPGHGAVHRILDKCWQALPRIKPKGAQDDEPGEWERRVGETLEAVQAWRKLRDLDRRNMVGRYAALIYRVADTAGGLAQPLKRAQKLVDLVPVYEHQIRVSRWHDDVEDAVNYGQPAMLQFCTSPPGEQDKQAQPQTWVDIHPSRVQFLAEGSVGNFLDGVPLLEAGYNHLVDLEKIAGGSAESFLKNSARNLVVEFEKDASPQTLTRNADGSMSSKSVKEVLQERVEDLNANVDKALVLQGATATTLQAQIADPRGPFEVAAQLFSASVRIPYTLLFGQQTGRLASDEDRAEMNARCSARQANELTPMVREFIVRMQACGVLPAGAFEIEWPPLDAPSEADKLGNLGKMTAAMQQASASGLGEPIADANELRAMVGLPPRADDGMPAEGDPEDDPATDPAGDDQQQRGRQPLRAAA